MMISKNCLFSLVRRSAVLTLLAGVVHSGLNAQQLDAPVRAVVPVSVNSSLDASLGLSASSLLPYSPAPPSAFSSSSVNDDLNYGSNIGAVETAAAEGFSLTGRLDQPPPRRRYGRPNYHDSRTNSDGSSKYTFVVGGGFTLPIRDTHNYLTTGYGLQVGAGRNFNKTFGLLAQFDYNHFGFQTGTLNDLLSIYQRLFVPDPTNPGSPISRLGGSSHIWSLTVDPIINYYTSDKFGAYAVGGGGFYHKTANFTTPSIGQYCDYYGYCYQYQANQTIDRYTSNAFGANGGLGFTYKFSRFANERFFTEARYVWIDNKPRPYAEPTSTTRYINVFPQNSAKTTYIPVTFGIRW